MNKLYENSVKPICVIPARGGSKRIPKKNITSFNGKPMIAWSIECAKRSNIFEKIYVSTDCGEIADIAEQYGAEVPYKRSSELSSDSAADIEVLEDFLNWHTKKKGELPDELCYLYATAPMITEKTLSECYEKLRSRDDVSCCFTVTKYDYPIMRSLVVDERDEATFKWPEYEKKRSQEIEEYYHDAGQCYFYNIKARERTSKRIVHIIPKHMAQDIDTFEDLKTAQILHQDMLRNEGKNK